MDSERRATLEGIMAILPTDEAAVIRLYQDFRVEIGQVVSFLAHKRRRDVDADDLEAMIFDSCLAIARVAKGWRADGGALPWVWARGRIANVVATHLPPATKPLSIELDLPAAPSLLDEAQLDDLDVSEALAALAAGDERVALLAAALGEAVAGPDAAVWLRYRIQQQSGDPAPAVTVAGELGMRAPAVRQRASRARRRLSAHVAAHPRYAAISDMALLASPAA